MPCGGIAPHTCKFPRQVGVIKRAEFQSGPVFGSFYLFHSVMYSVWLNTVHKRA